MYNYAPILTVRLLEISVYHVQECSNDALYYTYIDPNEPPTEEKATTALQHNLPSSSMYTRVNAVPTALIS